MKQIFGNVKNLLRKGLLSAMCLMLFLAMPMDAQAQQTIFRTGQLWSGVVPNGGKSLFEYYNLSWAPNDFNVQGPSMENGSAQTGSGMWMAATNWTDPNGDVIPKAVTMAVPSDDYSDIDPIVTPLENFLRWNLPLNYTIQDQVEDVEDTQVANWGRPNDSRMVGTADQVVTVTNQTAMGVEVERKIYGWAQQYHEDYIVCEVTLTNTSDQDLHDFYLNIHENNFQIDEVEGDNPSINIQNIPEYTWDHYYGAQTSDSLRIYYMYMADDATLSGDQMGTPVYNQDGRLYQPEMHFYGILHASEAPYTDPANDVDDPAQPSVSIALTNLDADIQDEVEGSGVSNADRPKTYDVIAGNWPSSWPVRTQNTYPNSTHQVPNDESGTANWDQSLPTISAAKPFTKRHVSFGPYEFGQNEKLHFIWVSGFSGLSLKTAKEVGEKWKAGTLEEPPNIPDARTGYFPPNFAFPSDATQMDKVKDRWLSTGIDSVHQAVSRAKWNFENNWQAIQAPQPPHMQIYGSGEGMRIQFAAPEAENRSNFFGYRVMRRTGSQDTTFYQEIHRVAADTATKETLQIGMTSLQGYKWVDKSAKPGASYYYYVQSGVEVTSAQAAQAPHLTAGEVIWSGRVFSTSRLDVSTKRPVGSALDSIRIAPNPYYISDPRLQGEGYGLDSDDPRLIMFFNLPSECTIKIFTEAGDLVKTIRHRETEISESVTAASGLERWEMLTDNQQAISSGVYIAVFETPSGQSSYQKFVVVR